jgi:hypothetical protein
VELVVVSEGKESSGAFFRGSEGTVIGSVTRLAALKAKTI